MRSVFLFVPFPQDIVNTSEDHYTLNTISAFTADRDRAARLIYPQANLFWNKTLPKDGNSGFVTTFALNAELRRAGTSDDPASQNYCLKSIWPNSRNRALSNIDPNDMLFIVGHSDYYGGWLSLMSNAGGRTSWYSIRVDLLAQLLLLEGLDLGHQYIKLNSCYGGGSEASERALARDLAKQLKSRFYNRVKVGGYQYVVEAPTLGRHTFELRASMKQEESGALVRSHPIHRMEDTFSLENNPLVEALMYEKDPYRVWYNGRGDCVRWNAPEASYGEKTHDADFGDSNLTPIPLIDLREGDALSAAYEKKKAAEKAWIKAMKSVKRRSRS